MDDMEWLLDQIPGTDTLGLEETKAGAVIEIIERRDPQTLPVTIGLFGTWGSGKTTTLGYVAQRLIKNNRFNVIYFNAWKYAGFMEAVPALIYKVLMAAALGAKEPPEEVLGQIILGLGRKYSEGLGEWTRLLTGADLVTIAKNLVDVRSIVTDAARPVAAAAKQYYTQLDRSQDLLAEMCQKSPRVIVALIDELDRCDPGEAFDVIKQLRVFFTMRKVPIVFVLAVNPDPIGQAIKHQFGLTSRWGDYEARKILEKFVDHYVEMENSNSIVEYVRTIWEAAGLDLQRECFIARVDAKLHLPPYEDDTLKHASFNECMLADNPVYANRRLLIKCLSRLKGRHETDRLWMAWHLEIAAQAYPALRRAIARLSNPIVSVAESAHKNLIEELRRSGCLEGTGTAVKGGVLKSDKGNTAFAAYRSFFWEGLREHRGPDWKNEPSQARRHQLENLLGDYRKVDFVATALMQPLGPIRFEADGRTIANWRDLFPDAHLGWVLSNF